MFKEPKIWKDKKYRIVQLYFYDLNAIYVAVVDKKFEKKEDIVEEVKKQFREKIGEEGSEILGAIYLNNVRFTITAGCDDDLDSANEYRSRLMNCLLKDKEKTGRYSILDLDAVNRRICEFFD